MKRALLNGRYATKSMVLLLAASLMLSCSTMNRAEKGAVIGVGAGAAVGAGIGKLAGNTGLGAVIGAAVGGAGGAMIGKYMDKQAKEMEAEMEAAKVERVGEGIKVTFDSGLLFSINSSDLSAKSKQELTNFSEVLNKYPDTNIYIDGHTDDTGSNEYNKTLSEKRANSVATYLANQKVERTRFTVRGFGEDQPMIENTSEANRAQNRRVEVIIVANEELVKQAKDGSLQIK